MKLNTGSDALLDTNTEGSERFQITANGTAFQILSSGLYSDKVRAVIRELACNAYDSHIAAGKTEVPITVILPTTLQATFTVRDYGTGLSHEQVVGLYTNYFSSDKRDSNSFTGGFGLGSKSPFAYTSSFSIIAKQNGIERVYLCHLNDDGAPSLKKISEQDKGESLENGVEVSFPVKSEDIEQFQYKALSVLQWFDTKPELIFSNKDWPKHVYLVEEAHYAIPARGHQAHGENMYLTGEACVKMGNVVYPLDWDSLMGDDKSSEYLVTLGHIELRLPVGSAAIAASREQLQYDPKTCSNIKRVLKAVARDFCASLIAQVAPNGVKTWAGAAAGAAIKRKVDQAFREKLCEMLESSALPGYRLVVEMLTSDSWDTPYIGETDGVSVHLLRKNATGRKVVRNGFYSVGDKSQRASLAHGDTTVILICDSNLVNERVRVARQMHIITQALIFSAHRENHDRMVEQAKKCSQEMGGVSIVYSSTLPTVNPHIKNPVVVQKNKAVFVPVDNRPVNYFDFTDGSLSEMTMADVPVEGRYYITKITKGVLAGCYDVGGSKHWVAVSDDDMHTQLENFGKGTAALFGRCPEWTAPHGAIIVRPVDIARLKLVEAGYLPWGEHMGNAMEAPEIKPVVEAFAEDYEDIATRYTRIYWREPWYAVFHILLRSMNNHSAWWDMFKAAGLDKDMRGYVLANAQSAAGRDAVHYAQTKLAEVGMKTGKLMRDVEQMNEKLRAAYPLLGVVSMRDLVEPGLRKNPKAMAQMFAGIFVVNLP